MSKVYSYAEKKALMDTAKDFSKWIKGNHGNIKMIKDIDSKIINEYLQIKSNTCTTNTIKVISSRLTKIGVLASTMFNRTIDWKTNEIPNGKETLRTVAMKEEDYKEIVSANSKSYGKIAVELSHAFGLRVSECVRIRVCDIKGNQLIIYKSKGGKTRVLDIENEEQKIVIHKMKVLSEKNNLDVKDKIINIKSQSANKWLRDRCKQLGITTYNNHKTSFHSIRKNWALREYAKEMNVTKDKKEAWSNVCEKLGHGRNREDLRNIYLPKN